MARSIRDIIRSRPTASLGTLTRLVFPSTCAGCNVAGTWLCERCRKSLIDLGSGPSIAASRKDIPGVHVVARYYYAEPIRRAIHLVKYDGQRARARWLAGELMPLLGTVSTRTSILQPVPLSSSRHRARGFNQAFEICKSLSSRSGLEVASHLVRVRDTRPQVELKGEDRIANVRGAFNAAENLAGRHVILVDDVLTTGATMRECAMACYKSGAARVSGLTVASG